LPSTRTVLVTPMVRAEAEKYLMGVVVVEVMGLRRDVEVKVRVRDERARRDMVGGILEG